MKYKKIKVEDEAILNLSNKMAAYHTTIRRLSEDGRKAEREMWRLLQQKHPTTGNAQWDPVENELSIPVDKEVVE